MVTTKHFTNPIADDYKDDSILGLMAKMAALVDELADDFADFKARYHNLSQDNR